MLLLLSLLLDGIWLTFVAGTSVQRVISCNYIHVSRFRRFSEAECVLLPPYQCSIGGTWHHDRRHPLSAIQCGRAPMFCHIPQRSHRRIPVFHRGGSEAADSVRFAICVQPTQPQNLKRCSGRFVFL